MEEGHYEERRRKTRKREQTQQLLIRRLKVYTGMNREDKDDIMNQTTHIKEKRNHPRTLTDTREENYIAIKTCKQEMTDSWVKVKDRII